MSSKFEDDRRSGSDFRAVELEKISKYPYSARHSSAPNGRRFPELRLSLPSMYVVVYDLVYMYVLKNCLQHTNTIFYFSTLKLQYFRKVKIDIFCITSTIRGCSTVSIAPQVIAPVIVIKITLLKKNVMK